MSTFKRLLNIGKGKAKVASREAGEAVGGSWTEDARHRAADAAEALAGAIRPEDALDDQPVSVPSPTTPAPETVPEAAPTVDAPKGPKKRRL